MPPLTGLLRCARNDEALPLRHHCEEQRDNAIRIGCINRELTSRDYNCSMQIAPGEYDTTMPTAAWHPKTRRLHDYWRGIHPGEDLPGRQHFDPLDIPDLMPQIWLVDVHHAPMRLRYRLVGTTATAIFRAELTGRWFHEAHPEFVPGAAHHAEYALAAASGQPICSWGKPILNYEPNFVQRERIILPLARNGRHVDMMLCMMVVFGRDGREAL